LTPTAPDTQADRDGEITDGNRRTSEMDGFTQARMGVLQTEPQHTEPSLASVFRVPERLGPWRLIRMLGRGGMGEVWLAERCDGVFSKSVAVKLLRSDRGEVHERFRQERQVLAELDHPNIASLIDGGVTPEGSPYLVTEYIEGAAIDRWCGAEKLGLRERIELFLQVCDAVSYAHSQLVVHRDIKPGNILIDQSGRAHLLDFGIAKLVNSVGPDEITDESPHTPEYAAPEQVQGGAISVKTDVYAMGLLLYVLLTGSRPQAQIAGQGLAQQIDCIVNQLASLPSTSITPEMATIIAARDLRGDLDTIILRAIQKAPANRFRSVGTLADDLRRYLAGKPIASRRIGVWETITRFVRAHWFGVIVGGLGTMAVVAGLAVASFQQLRAKAEQAHAEQRARETAAARSFTTSMLSDLQLQGIANKALLQQAQRYAQAELVEFPELEAGVIWDIATGYANLGLYTERASLIREHYQQKQKGRDAEAKAAASCVMATIKAEAGDRAGALELLADADNILLDREETNWAFTDCALVGGRALRQLGEFSEAEMRLARGVTSLKDNPNGMHVHAPELLVELSNVQIQSAQYAAASKTLAGLFPLLAQSSRQETNVAQVARHNYGQALRNLGQFAQAKVEFEKSIALQALRRADTVSANTLCALAVVEQQLGNQDAALARLEQCRNQRASQQQTPVMQSISYERDAAEVALAQGDWHNFDEAMARIQTMLVGFDPNSNTVQSMLALRAEKALKSQDYPECERLLTSLINPDRRRGGHSARAFLVALEFAAVKHDRSRAQAMLQEIEKLRNDDFPADHPLYVRAKRVWQQMIAD
jgi:eukaryotic-like serine/threonine-protein kinase